MNKSIKLFLLWLKYIIKPYHYYKLKHSPSYLWNNYETIIIHRKAMRKGFEEGMRQAEEFYKNYPGGDPLRRLLNDN